jgi:hypothetical protein
VSIFPAWMSADRTLETLLCHEALAKLRAES